MKYYKKVNNYFRTVFTITVFIFFAGFSCGQTNGNKEYIRAYYTKIDKGNDWEKLSRTQQHADILVELQSGKIEFWRGTSYLPVWVTPKGSWSFEEVISRKGDGPKERPDMVNSFSSVRIISEDENSAVVHWRYLPTFDKGNPKLNVDHRIVVDEYFTINANGKVTRTIKQGTVKVDDWISNVGVITQTFDLIENGINNLETKKSNAKVEVVKVQGNPVKENKIGTPVLTITFDEGKGSSSGDAIIDGNKNYWKKGVSGTALAFDGYTSKVTVPANKVVELEQFSINSWVALGAYPFNWAPIVQQTEFGKRGFFLGVGPSGKIGFRIKAGKWTEINSKYELPLRQWVQVSATYDGEKVIVYVDGIVVALQSVKKFRAATEKDILIGFNSLKQNPADPVRDYCEECHTPSLFGFDGLIDEVRLYNTVLSVEDIKASFDNFKPTNVTEVDLEERVYPTGPTTGEFKAHYTGLKYYDTWDNYARFGKHSDIVVEFDDNPTKYIFWRGMSYVPNSVNPENQWYNNQFNEAWEEGGSWGEPMSDKQSLRSSIRLIENTPARKLVHWRYAQIIINGHQQNFDAETGWGDWSDWYFYVYPDGVVSKRMIHYSGDNPLNHEWQESIGVMSPGDTPESICDVHGETVYLDDMEITKSYNWHEEIVEGSPLERDWETTPMNIQLVNYNSKYKPFTIGKFKGAEYYGDADGELAPYSNMVVYIHWPIGQLPTDGARAIKPDRGSSNGYTHLIFDGHNGVGDNWAQRSLLEGMTTKTAAELRPLKKSWLEAPQVDALTGAKGGEYDIPERAYKFTLNKGATNLGFVLKASEANPIENACFVIKNWKEGTKAKLKLNGQDVAVGKGFRQGEIIDTDGSRTLIVFIKHSGKTALNVKLENK